MRMRRSTATAVESRRDRLALVEDAGFRRISVASVLAGVMCAYGTFVMVLGITGGILRAAGVDTNFSANDWRRIGSGAGILVALVLFISYFFGGYVAGRMSRRAGTTHGVLVFVLGLVLLGVAAVIANAATDSADILRNLRSVGIPTSWDEWRDIGTVVGIASLVAMLLGSVVGGAKGERWHGRLLARAADPAVGNVVHGRADTDVTDVAADREDVMTER